MSSVFSKVRRKIEYIHNKKATYDYAPQQGGWEKYGSPVFGDETTASVFDPFVVMIEDRYRLFVSERKNSGIICTDSTDGTEWEKWKVALEAGDSLNVDSARDHYISTTLLAITVFLFTLQCHGSNKTLALIGRKYSTWLYILHPIFITCIGMVAHKVGVYGIYKFIAPIVVCITTLIFLMIVDKIKMAAVIDR